MGHPSKLASSKQHRSLSKRGAATRRQSPQPNRYLPAFALEHHKHAQAADTNDSSTGTRHRVYRLSRGKVASRPQWLHARDESHVDRQATRGVSMKLLRSWWAQLKMHARQLKPCPPADLPGGTPEDRLARTSELKETLSDLAPGIRIP
jgi:hypothetical protein